MAMSDPYAEPIETGPWCGNPDPGNLVPSTLDGFALEPGCVEGVALQSLEAGTVLNVITRHSGYRVVVLDPVRRRVLVTGGRLFPERTEVRFEGATAGGSVLKIGWIGTGLRLEMSMGLQRITTSRVRSVTIESESPVKSSVFCGFVAVKSVLAGISVLAARIGTVIRQSPPRTARSLLHSLSASETVNSVRMQTAVTGAPRLRGISRTALHACALSSPAFVAELAASQPVGTGRAQIRCNIAPNRRRVR